MCSTRLHESASKSAFHSYIDCFHDGAVFVGTDAEECWDMEKFSKKCKKLFRQGKSWTYVPVERTIDIAGSVAWFYERLYNEKYGPARGSGVLAKVGDRWRIAQYVLSFPVPNDITEDFGPPS